MEQQHGKLINKNSGVEIPGNLTLAYKNLATFHFQIDGVTDFNVFRGNEWDFEADPKPLPTEPGLYQHVPGPNDTIEHAVTYRFAMGQWSDTQVDAWHASKEHFEETEAVVQKSHNNGQLVRLIREEI